MDELRVKVAEQNPSIICVVESWLSDDISHAEISINNYQVIRLDRNRYGGGILLYIIKSLTWEIILKGSYDLEFIALSVTSALTTVKVTGTHVYCAITATTFMHPCQFLRRLGTKSVLDSNLFRPAYCLKDELPAEAWLP